MTKSLEDYVEAIYRLSQEGGRARVVDVAAMLHVKMPSVNNAVKELARLKLVKYEKYRELILTDEGAAVACTTCFSRTSSSRSGSPTRTRRTTPAPWSTS